MTKKKTVVTTRFNILEQKLNIPLEYNRLLIEEAYKIGDKQAKTSNVKATMSDWEIFQHTKVFNPLLKNIMKACATFFTPEGNDPNNWVLHEAWTAIYKKGEYAKEHHHLPSVVSFTYYMQSDGYTLLCFSRNQHKVFPTNDTLIAFPSFISHSVPKHNTPTDRVVLAGNINWGQKVENYIPSNDNIFNKFDFNAKD